MYGRRLHAKYHADIRICMYIHRYVYVLLSAVAIVGFEDTLYTVVEGDGEVEICVNVYQPGGEVPVEFSFEVGVMTGNGTAGTYTHNSHAHSLCR